MSSSDDDVSGSSDMFALTTITRKGCSTSSLSEETSQGFKVGKNAAVTDLVWKETRSRTCLPTWVTRSILFQIDALLLLPVLTPFALVLGFLPMLIILPRALYRKTITPKQCFVWFGKILFALSSTLALLNIVIGFIFYFETNAQLYEIYGPFIIYALLSFVWVSLSNELFVDDRLRFGGRSDHAVEGDYRHPSSAFYTCWRMLSRGPKPKRNRNDTDTDSSDTDSSDERPRRRRAPKTKSKKTKTTKKNKAVTKKRQRTPRLTARERLDKLNATLNTVAFGDSDTSGAGQPDRHHSVEQARRHLAELVKKSSRRAFWSRFTILFLLPFLFATWQALIVPVYRVYAGNGFAPVKNWYDGVIIACAFYCFFIETFFAFWMLLRAGLKFSDARNALRQFNAMYVPSLTSPLAVKRSSSCSSSSSSSDEETGKVRKRGYHLNIVDQHSADIYVAVQNHFRRRFNAQAQNLTPAAAVCVLAIAASGFVAGVQLFSNNPPSAVRNIGYMTVVMYDIVIVGVALLWYLHTGMAAHNIGLQQLEYLAARRVSLISTRPHTLSQNEYDALLETLSGAVLQLQSEGPPTVLGMPITGVTRNLVLCMMLLGFGVAWARYVHL